MTVHDSSPPRRVIILGSTGSIGVNTLAVIEHLAQLPEDSRYEFDVIGLATGSCAEKLELQAAAHDVQDLAIAEATNAHEISNSRKLRSGPDAALELVNDIARPGDLVVGAMVGAAGIPAILAAIKIGCDIALANKETLVAAGALVTERARSSGVQIIPIDSEHSAIFQLLENNRNPEEIQRVVLTASGGPFRTWSKERMGSATIEEALHHPTWTMGPKVTIDSASLMNKGLELIEAHWLFGLPAEKLDAIVHPQSIVHSFVEFIDGSVVAQLAPPDMQLPIQYAITWPRRVEGCAATLAFDELESLEFQQVDPDRFPALRIAKEAIRSGGTAGAIFNAANEAAVESFLAGSIAFSRIAELVEETSSRIKIQPADSLEAILAADQEAREIVRSLSGAVTRF